MSKNVKDKVLSARITYQQYDKLSKIALELDMSRSEIISYLIDNGTVNSESIKRKSYIQQSLQILLDLLITLIK